MQRITLGLLAFFMLFAAYANDTSVIQKANRKKQELNNAGLVLPTGFSAVALADSFGKARHIAVTK